MENTTLTGKISEKGNGLDVRVGEYAWCSENNTLYEITDTGTIQTAQWKANWMEVEMVESTTEVTTLTDAEFEQAWMVEIETADEPEPQYNDDSALSRIHTAGKVTNPAQETEMENTNDPKHLREQADLIRARINKNEMRKLFMDAENAFHAKYFEPVNSSKLLTAEYMADYQGVLDIFKAYRAA